MLDSIEIHLIYKASESDSIESFVHRHPIDSIPPSEAAVQHPQSSLSSKSLHFLFGLVAWWIVLGTLPTPPVHAGVVGTYDLTVTSDNPPIFVPEADTQLDLTIELVGAGVCSSSWSGITWAVNVDFNGDAGPGDVGNPFPTSLSFSDATPTANLQIALSPDTMDEPDESFEISLTPLNEIINCSMPSGSVMPNLNDYRILVTIVDDDLGLEFVIQDTQVIEGDAGSPNVEVTIDMLNGPFGQDVTIDWNTSDGTATTGDNDYLPAGGTLTIFSGQTFTKALIPVVGDTNPEPDEQFNVSIFNPSQGTVIDNNADVTILDDDTGPPLELVVQDVTVVEGDTGFQNAEVTIDLLNGPAPFDVTMSWTTFDATATTADGDYQFADGFITIPAGDVSTKVTVPVIGDTVEEPDEFFEVKIFDAIGADILDERGDVTIQNDDGPMFSVSVVDAQSVLEGDSGLTSMVFTVEVNALASLGSSGRRRTLPAMSVDFLALPGTAATNIDFQATSGTLDIVDDSPQTVVVRIIGDTLEEPNENLFLRLSNPINVVIADNEGEGVIIDDDSPVGELSVGDAQVDEGDEGSTEMTFEVHLAPAQDAEVQVSYETLDVSATVEGGDYQSTQGQLTFQPGQTLQTLSVEVNGDLESEGDEVFQVRLFDPVGADLADDLGDGTIVDDDVATLPTISIGDAGGLEGDSGSTQVELTVTLSQPADGTVEVSYSTADGTATAGVDYQADTGLATIQPGETSTTITVSVLGDTAEEGDEFFTVVLSEPQGAELGDGEGRVTVIDDDQPPVLSIEDARVVEGDEGQRSAVFTLRLEQQTKARVMVDFATRDGSALASDNDYVPVSGRLDFDSGDSTVTLEVPVIGDLRPEDDETFFVDLSAPDGAVLGDATAQALIVDDDSDGGPGGSAGSIRLIPAEAAMEGAGPAVIQVERFGGSTGVVSVLLSTADASATAGQDYQAFSQRIQWTNGQSGPQAIEIPILNDAVREDGEAFGVVLSNPAGATLGTPSQISVSIVDDDTPMALEAVGELERTATVRTEQVFQARVVGEGGEPVEGAVVRWSAEGQARLPDEGRTVSGADGLAEQTVLFANRPGDASIVARLVGSDEPLTYTIEVRGDLSENLGDDGGDGSDEPGVAGVLDASCADAGSSRYSELCDFVYGLANVDDQRDVVDQLTPRSTLAQAKTTLRAPAQQIRNVTSRLSALRGGSAGSAFGQLAFAVQGDSISLGPLQQAVVSASQPSSNEGFERPLSRAIEDARANTSQTASSQTDESPWRRGGAASGDEEDPTEDLDPYDSTESPWGFFMNGRASFGDAPRRGVDPGYDFTTQGLTAGVDYRVSDQWVVGSSIGYSRSDTDLAGFGGRRDGGSIDTEGLSLSVFTSWYREDFYLDGVVTFGQTDLETERVIDLPSSLNGRDRFVAAGAPDGDELSLHLGFGYDFRVGEALNLSGFVNGNYVRATVDSYTETGADLLNLIYDEQELESLLAEIGVELTYPYSLSWGVVQPLVRVAFLRELEDDPQIVRARFAEDSTGRRFRLASERPDRSYLNVALGLTATLQRGWATYFQYDTDLERDDLDIYTLSGGFRFQF